MVGFLIFSLIGLTTYGGGRALADPTLDPTLAPVPKELKCLQCPCVEDVEGLTEYNGPRAGNWQFGTGGLQQNDPFVASLQRYGSLPAAPFISTDWKNGAPIPPKFTAKSMVGAVAICPLPGGENPATTAMRTRCKTLANPNMPEVIRTMDQFSCRN